MHSICPKMYLNTQKQLNIIALDNFIPNLVAFLKRKYKHTNAMTLIHI